VADRVGDRLVHGGEEVLDLVAPQRHAGRQTPHQPPDIGQVLGTGGECQLLGSLVIIGGSYCHCLRVDRFGEMPLLRAANATGCRSVSPFYAALGTAATSSGV
jgi:hypothetical protein